MFRFCMKIIYLASEFGSSAMYRLISAKKIQFFRKFNRKIWLFLHNLFLFKILMGLDGAFRSGKFVKES